jgi:hypothetical protein
MFFSNMCTKFKFLIVAIALTGTAFCQSVGIRAGIGQFASQADQIDGSTGNCYLFGLSLKPKKTFMLDIGARYNKVNETNVQFNSLTSSLFSIEKVTQKVAYAGAYIAPGVNFDLSQIGSGMALYFYGGGGIGFANAVTRVYYTNPASTPTYFSDDNYNRWKPFWLVGSGLKLQIFYFGIFGEFSYFDGKEVEYSPVQLYDVEILGGGKIKPKGFAAYLGICWN